MTKDELRHLGEVVRTGRARLQLNQLEFCKQAGITRNTLRAIERGVQHPQPETLERLARLLGKTTVALMGHGTVDRADPLLDKLNEEDLEVAQAFHHAPQAVRTRVLGVLQEVRAGRRSRVDPAASWVDRLLALAPEQRAAVTAVIAEFETIEAPEAPARGSGGTAKKRA